MMDKNERIVLRNYLTSFESRKKGHKPQSIVLLDLLEKYEDDKKLITLFKKKVPSEDARRMIISRLREKMFASLTLDVNIARGEVYDEQAQALVSVSQAKVQGRLLIGRGQRKLGFFVLERGIQLAKQYEMYDDLVDMLSVERQFIKAWKGTDEAYYDVDQELNNYAVCRDAVHLAKKYYEEITLKYGFKGLSRVNPDPEQLEFLRSRMEELNKAFETTSSATVGYYYYYLLIEFNQLQNNLKEASEHLNSLAQMLENNPSIRRRVRLATVYGNLGANELWMHHFDVASGYFEEAIKYLRANTRNHAVITEYLFYTKFYSGKMQAARDILEQLVNSDHVEQTEFRKATRNYLLACVAFALGEYKQVSKYLLETSAMGKDKEGWNIGSRVLSIMNAIETDDHDYADSLILNLRQFMREGLKEVDVRERDKAVLEILVELRKKSYDFEEVFENKKELFQRLSENNIEYGWTLQTPEMISFHTWFIDRYNEQPYAPNYSREHLFGGQIS